MTRIRKETMRLCMALMGATLISVSGCERPDVPDEELEPASVNTRISRPLPGTATEKTAAANRLVSSTLDIARESDQVRATRGLLARLESDAILDSDGRIVWNIASFDFLDTAPPDTANPALWRHMQLTAEHGLFEVLDGIYQVRGYDLAVMTVIHGKMGWIVVDPLTTIETATAAIELVQSTLGKRPITGLIYTHSHADHFGGAEGIVEHAKQFGTEYPIVAPHKFTEEAVAENLLAGAHMARRSILMYGSSLDTSPAGKVGSGLGPGLASGTISLVLPTEELPPGINDRVIDGVEFQFMDAAGTEAPSEFVFYLPELKALCTSEVVTGTFHNILTIRGARVRDALVWSKSVDRIIQRYSGTAEVLFASHHWPVWGTAQVSTHLRHHRDLYRKVHDQTLRFANAGATRDELPSLVEEPSFATKDLSVRGYYGSHTHNTKAVYQHYFGWWGGNPATFDPHTPVERAKRFVSAVGGESSALKEGKAAFSKGDYRWATEVFGHVVFANPESTEAKLWLASSFEQLGFLAESGATRNYYLSAAKELRSSERQGSRLGEGAESFLKAVPTEALFDALAARYDPTKIESEPYTLQFKFTDTQETVSVEIGPDTAFPRYGVPAINPKATFATTRALFNDLVLKKKSALVLVVTGKIKIDGSRGAVTDFFDALEEPPSDFAIATP
ncbi:MAG: alkyl sulfatase dimerization domain-containing protein [Pseudomonadota bacterium]